LIEVGGGDVKNWDESMKIDRQLMEKRQKKLNADPKAGQKLDPYKKKEILVKDAHGNKVPKKSLM
jgi:hypothetical protein